MLIFLILWLITVILAPILSQMMAMCVSRRREYLADATGAELTRNPLALASALEKIDASLEPTRSINQGSAHLCIADPKGHALGLKEGRIADLFATHPPIQKRIEALKKMLSPTITVLRGGREEEVPSKELVPGDMLLLEAGDKILRMQGYI
jgi:heat shock protein HtpX